MAPRVPTITRLAYFRPLSVRTAFARIPAWPLSFHSDPTQTISHLRRCTLSTTAARPSPSGPSWLLSALPNLSPLTPTPPPPKTLRARRQLPYPPSQIYTLIADIDSYRLFLPHCTHSRVTGWTTPTPTPTSNVPTAPSSSTSAGGGSGPPETKYPAQADLTVGWGPFTQTYTSRVYCVPGSVVEAVSGQAETSIAREVLRSVGYQIPDVELENQKIKMEGIFESLITRWTVAPVLTKEGAQWSEVTLSVTFQFANPALGFAVGQLADDKVDEMVAAFEGRARALYGR